MAVGRELPNQDKIKYLGILEAGIIKQAEMKENILKRLSQENKKITWNQTIR